MMIKKNKDNISDNEKDINEEEFLIDKETGEVIDKKTNKKVECFLYSLLNENYRMVIS